MKIYTMLLRAVENAPLKRKDPSSNYYKTNSE